MIYAHYSKDHRHFRELVYRLSSNIQNPEYNIIRIESLDEITDEVPFFSEKKLYIAHHSKEMDKAIKNLNLADDTDLAIWVRINDEKEKRAKNPFLKIIDSMPDAKVTESPAITRENIRKKSSVPLSEDIVDLIYESATDWDVLMNNIAKLEYHPEGSIKELEGILTRTVTTDIFNLTNALSREYNTLYDRYKEMECEIGKYQLFILLGNHYKKIAKVKLFAESGEKDIATKLKLHPFYLKNLLHTPGNSKSAMTSSRLCTEFLEREKRGEEPDAEMYLFQLIELNKIKST